MHGREVGRRLSHPSHVLTSRLSQHGNRPVEVAGNDAVKAAFAEHAERGDITDDNKNTLLLECARRGLASRVRAVLQAGADVAHTDQVRVGA